MLRKIKSFLVNHWISVSATFILAIFAIVVVLPSLSEDATSSIWDGTVASGFANGDGTSTDPYEINTGSELAYFFDIMDDVSYFNKYYELTNNIDLHGYDFSNINTTNYFSGSFDGNGYTIYNFKINNFKNNDDYSYSLFPSLKNANIQNLNISNVEFNTSHANSTVGIISDASGSILKNISLTRISVNANVNSEHIAGLLTVDKGLNQVQNINVDFSSNQEAYTIINNSTNNRAANNSSFTNILIKNNGLNNYPNSSYFTTGNITNYTAMDNNVETLLNQMSDEDIVWSISDNQIRVVNNSNVINNHSSVIDEHESGISDGVVYVNDFDADYNYFMGLNYTSSSNRALPTRVNKNLYSDNNLVFVQASYNGRDYQNHLDSSTGYVGYVSVSERYNKFVYYKVYRLNNNGTANNLNDDYIEFDLIDNPFANRPNNRAFNGWITDYMNANIRLDLDTYVRKVKVPVTYSNGKPEPIVIDFYASWTEATTYNISGSNNWNNAFNNIKEAKMERANGHVNYWDIQDKYYGLTIARYTYYQEGDYYRSGNTWYQASSSSYCNSNGGCEIRRPVGNDEYNSNLAYYSLTVSTSTSWWSTTYTYTFTKITPQHIDILYEGLLADGIAAGFYLQNHINNGESRVGLYDEYGNYYTSGTCTTNGGCTYYRLVDFYDSQGNINYADPNLTYYYLVTRDTNILAVSGNVTGVWTSANQTKPFTITALNNGVDNSNRYTWSVSSSDITCNADVRIEWIKLYSSRRLQTNDAAPSTSYANFYGNWKNTKIGRGIIANGTYATFDSAGGGSANSTGNTVQNYTFIVESGFYNNLGLSALASYSGNMYIKGVGIFGSDVDRVSNNNSKLTVQYCLSAAWAGNIYSDDVNTFGLTSIIKSGSYGVNEYDYAAGVYIGGRASGSDYILRRGFIEGGEIFNLIGGPLAVQSNVTSGNTIYNQDYIYMKGGSVDIVIGGAGASETFGNRIVQVTGGTVNYAVFGGSNGVSGSDGGDYPGILYGNSYVYIGGNAIIGDEAAYNAYLRNGTLHSNSRVEPGSVFGAGNGNSTSISVGAVNNSYVIIDGDALVRNNVYGGGNYGAVGYGDGDVNSYSNCATEIYINGGTINGSVFGAANNNGSGNYQHNVTTGTGRNATTAYYYNVNANINIYQNGGIVKDSIYGGSNISGTVYGPTTVNIYEGQCNNVYGGGKGNNTFVRDSVVVNIGDTNKVPNINGNVYGGSAFGTVNATSTSASNSSNTTTVNINNGNILGSIYGGGQGSSTYTPYVKGNITVNMNNGTAYACYAAYDQAGTPTGTDRLYLNGGVVGYAYGGGNRTNVNNTEIFEQGSTVGYLYGGSNMLGTIPATNVTMTSGNVNYLFGGNNLGGNVTTTNVNITGGRVIYEVYGGGNQVATGTTNVNISAGNINDVYGGGNEASVTTTYITLDNISANKVYGGSNASGTVTNANISINNNTINDIYGGNNVAGNTVNSEITINSGTINNIYGGGNEASSGESKVIVNAGTIVNLYGGGNNAVVDNTDVSIYGGVITNLYGGGNHGAINNQTKVFVENGNITNLYGGGNQAGANTTDVKIDSGTITNLYGGSNQQGLVNTSNIETSSSDSRNELRYVIDYTVEPADWRSNVYRNAINAEVRITNNTAYTFSTYSGYFYLDETTIYSNWSQTLINENNHLFTFDEHNQFNSNINSIGPGQTYTFNFVLLTNLDESEINFSKSLSATDGTHNYSSGSTTFIGNIYGGNNQGGLTSNTNVNITGGTCGNVFGGGNQAASNNTNVTFTNGTINNLFAGGNEASVNGNTSLNITGGEIIYNSYGGGNEGLVTGNTNVNMNGGHVNGRIFAGGNGSTAIVRGNTNIVISGTSVIGNETCTVLKDCSVFGSGNAAATGVEGINNSVSTVAIAGGTIYGNVYGGANTSVVYGETITNIGANVTISDDVIANDIFIGGTVFGGGEANAEGDAMFDFNAKSVTGGLTINIDGGNYSQLIIEGSIFGSGNASSSAGTSIINVSNIGTSSNPQRVLSIQRSDIVTINNSSLLVTGATDSENNYSDRKFSLSKIDELYLKNNSTLYLENNALMLAELHSVTASGAKATAVVNSRGELTRNVNNRIYMYEGKNLNISRDSNNQDYGDVYGMTFFGMYNYTHNNVDVGIYCEHLTGDTLNWTDLFDLGSYVQAIHQTNYETDGFYSNFMNEDTQTNEIRIIVPQPPNADYHEWIIGSAIKSYEIDLEASKYSTLGTVELPFNDYYQANTTFVVLGFDYSNLAEGIQIIDESSIPRINADVQAADTNIGIAMKSSVGGWLNNGETNFYSRNSNNIIGTTTYIGDASTTTPSLLFYLYHSKNINTSGDMGTVSISMLVIRKIDALTNQTERISININLSRVLFETNAYEAAISPGRQYELFTPSTVNITNKSSFSAYYSFFTMGNYPYENYHRSLVTNTPIPAGTKITMIDLSLENEKKYYYYVVTEQDVRDAENSIRNTGDYSLLLSKFQVMGALNSYYYYNDYAASPSYYDWNMRYAEEEFIFIFDFEDTDIPTNLLNNSILFEGQNNEGRTLISVLGIQATSMNYNIYAEDDATIHVTPVPSKDHIYSGDTITIDTTFTVSQARVGSNTIYDTKSFNSKMGVELSLINSDGEIVPATSLLGLYYEIDGTRYYPNIDGTTRINLTEKVGNYEAWIKLCTENVSLATGQYKLRFTSFASADGIYYGLTPASVYDLDIYIINEIYGLKVTTDEANMVIDGITGKNNNNQSTAVYNLEYNSGLANPSIRVKLYRRDYSTTYSTLYQLVDLSQYISNHLAVTTNQNEYYAISTPGANSSFTIMFDENLTTGTYKLEFVLYDNDSSIGSVEKYFIIK